MTQLLPPLTLVALGMFVNARGAWPAPTSAEMCTPTGGASDAALILIEHADRLTEIDLAEPGLVVGDVLVWGPNPLYDKADATDTVAYPCGRQDLEGRDAMKFVDEACLSWT